ncbi:MAG: transposase [Sedimentisphaerales bacterium]|nr:transposase [Sedimentisphaerales bacterium]
MLTWTTYGSWLPGDQRGYVADAEILPGDERILERNRKRRKSPAVKLNAREKEIVEQTIRAEAEKLGHKLEAVIVCSNHVHLLARRHAQSIEEIVGRYKSLTTRALWQQGRKGRIWSICYDKRFCFTEQDIATKAKYIQNHNDSARRENQAQTKSNLTAT